MLRDAGIQKPILVLGGVYSRHQYEDMVRYESEQLFIHMRWQKGMSEAAARLGSNAIFHIKLDTGMGRIGFPISEESVECIEQISKLEHVVLEGMFTHFAKADETDKTYT